MGKGAVKMVSETMPLLPFSRSGATLTGFGIT